MRSRAFGLSRDKGCGSPLQVVGTRSHKHIPNYCALRWRARAVVSSIRPRSNSKEVPLEGRRYIEGIVFVIFAIFCEKESSEPPEKGAAPRKALREENTRKFLNRRSQRSQRVVNVPKLIPGQGIWTSSISPGYVETCRRTEAFEEQSQWSLFKEFRDALLVQLAMPLTLTDLANH